MKQTLKLSKMKDLKITPGDWLLDSNSEDRVTRVIVPTNSGEKILAAVYTASILEGEANAKLMAEAGTVANECGLTPRQLLEQRNELLKACVSSVEQLKYELGEIGHDPSVGIDASDIIRAIETAELAIKKATE